MNPKLSDIVSYIATENDKSLAGSKLGKYSTFMFNINYIWLLRIKFSELFAS